TFILTNLTIKKLKSIDIINVLSDLVSKKLETTVKLPKDFKHVVISSAILSSICFIIGLSISYLYAAPTGASIVIVNLVVLCITQLIHNVSTK
ncbi:metal ABC transporter permease, partial [Catenibacterium mitsuokai]